MIASDHPRLDRILVVGCGSGLEAAILAQRLGAKVTGIDVMTSFDPIAARHARLLTCDARSLPFRAETFDYVYSFHALEHIPQPSLAVREMHRVLRPDGGFFVGTPNRSRLVGYVGSKGATLRQKIAWNTIDWRARLRGQFRNDLGRTPGSPRPSSVRCCVRSFLAAGKTLNATTVSSTGAGATKFDSSSRSVSAGGCFQASTLGRKDRT